MLVRFRLSVPDRPGMLGRVASAIGTAGADIVSVDVLESSSGRALDDVLAQIRDAHEVERVRRALLGVSGVQVIAVQHPVPPASGHTELELLAQVTAQIVTRQVGAADQGLRTLVDGAPGALGADWAVLMEFAVPHEPGVVIGMSPRCPGADHAQFGTPLRLATVRVGPPHSDDPYAGAALVPLGSRPLGLLLVRETGPAYHRAELWRLEQFGKVVGAAQS